MLMTEIERDSLGVATWSPEVVAVAEEAEAVLGYSVLKKAQSQKEETDKPLAAALVRLGIEPLNTAQVKAYKMEQQKETSRAVFEAWMANPEANQWLNLPNWHESPLADYKQPVPEFVLHKAIQIKRECPEVELFVDALEVNPDPFLVALIRRDEECSWDKGRTFKAEKERYFVEVWAEPKFEGKL